jgi:glycosyltransferase involved in cell wall biosynthesis
MSLLLRRLGLVDHVVYYSIDYYPAKNFLNKIFIRMDSICFRNADVVWNLSSPIMNARHSNLGIVRASKETIVPLSYPAKVLTIRAMSDIERWSISYAGVIDELHGLQLLFEALPEVLEHLPNVILRIVGLGPYSDHLKLLTKKLGLEQHVIFHGFLQQPDMLDLLSRCAIGIAPFVPVPENNATYSDSGKPKLYAFCGLPVIITKVYSGFLVASNKAGILVDYNVRELAKAIVSLLNDEQRLNQFRQKARDYALSCTSERVYGDALKSTSAAIGSFKRVRSRI